MRRVALAVVAVVSLAPWMTRVTGAGTAATTTIEPALRRFLARPDEPLTQYRAVRHLEASNERFNLSATLDAITELLPDGRFTYAVVRETGSDYIRTKVLHPLLEHEVEVAGGGDPSRFAISAGNYELTAGELADDGTVKLLVKPRRRDVGLIDGAVFVTTADADMVRIEGRLVKNPSFWTTRVDLVRSYGRLGGVRVPVRLDTTAHIRFAGVSTMSMTYDYETINGRPVESASANARPAREEMASAHP
jgi:hypothetical protein